MLTCDRSIGAIVLLVTAATCGPGVTSGPAGEVTPIPAKPSAVATPGSETPATECETQLGPDLLCSLQELVLFGTTTSLRELSPQQSAQLPEGSYVDAQDGGTFALKVQPIRCWVWSDAAKRASVWVRNQKDRLLNVVSGHGYCQGTGTITLGDGLVIYRDSRPPVRVPAIGTVGPPTGVVAPIAVKILVDPLGSKRAEVHAFGNIHLELSNGRSFDLVDGELLALALPVGEGAQVTKFPPSDVDRQILKRLSVGPPLTPSPTRAVP